MKAPNRISELFTIKKEVKLNFCDDFGLNSQKPLIGIFLDKDLSSKEEKILMNFLKGMPVLSATVVILADGEYERVSRNNVKVIPYNRENRQKLMEGADMAVSFEFNDVEEMLICGTVPISNKRKEMQDYNPNTETGNGFVYGVENEWAIFAAVVRAIETFKFPYDWKHLVSGKL